MAVEDKVSQSGKVKTLKKSVVPINVPSLEEASQYAMEAAFPPPNTDNSLICIRAERNLDALDSYLNEDFDILPYRYNVDTISLDNPMLLKLLELKVQPSKKITEEKLDKIADDVAKKITARAKSPKNTTAKNQQLEEEREA